MMDAVTPQMLRFDDVENRPYLINTMHIAYLDYENRKIVLGYDKGIRHFHLSDAEFSRVVGSLGWIVMGLPPRPGRDAAGNPIHADHTERSDIVFSDERRGSR